MNPVIYRLPQDVTPGDERGVPDLASLNKGATIYAEQHARALKRNSAHARAEACWGLVAAGSSSLDWVHDCFDSGDVDRIADAGGVLVRIGVPPDWVPWIRSTALALPDGESADVLFELLDVVDPPPPAEDEARASQYLFGGARQPFTEPIWFLRAPLEQTSVELAKRMTGPGGRRLFTLREPLTRMLDRLEPFSIPSWKQLIVGTTGDWTAVFSQGSDIYTANVIAETLGVASVRTHYSPRIVRNGKVVSYGDCAFWFKDGSGNSRTIQASLQSRWEWHLDGDPLPFEDQDAYDAKRIPDRFTLERLNEYCHAVGIKRNDPDLYRSEGILVEEDVSTWVREPTNMMSSARWRAIHR